jgi:hypothetical protein
MANEQMFVREGGIRGVPRKNVSDRKKKGKVAVA